MLISHNHKYVFVELPRTGSTAISKELRENYSGERIQSLRKHAYFHEFQKISSPEEKQYFIFSCVRNPLDDVVSIYIKFSNIIEDEKVKHQNRRSARRIRFIENNTNFAAFLKKFYKIPYDNWGSLAHAHFDYVIRYERIQTDFAKVLKKIGIKQKRPLPVINKTKGKANYLSYYTSELYSHTVYVFGPFMKRWGYEFPIEWGECRVPIISDIMFNLFALPRQLYWRYLKNCIRTD